ncbi:MAG TPA: peptide chain release factor N(5)-glutamine methyltransferase [Desulfonatronum sp.]|mgnify:CR=1 FL=1|nr:peptide chain release factor N(5)-glutamine methyltransferase [Desulfonatronum sp.]
MLPGPLYLRDILGKSAAYLEQRGIDAPRLSAELMVAHALDMERLGLYLDLDRPLTEQELSRIRPLLARRGQGEPVAYILGRKEFYGLEFLVTKDVLIPRPETELGVDLARGLFSPKSPLLFADVGTGSGALAVALLIHFPNSRCLASDKSLRALRVAQVNFKSHGVASRLLMTQADLLPHLAAGSLDLIVANLPYLSEAEHAAINHEVAEFEPKEALVGGPCGHELFEPLLGQAMTTLKPGGHLLLETGYSQSQSLAGKIHIGSSGWRDIQVFQDYAGLDRYVHACWSPVEKKQQHGLRKHRSLIS